MKNIFISKLTLLITLLIFGNLIAEEKSEKAQETATESVKIETTLSDIKIVIVTSKGDIEATIFSSKVPMTAANFVNLAQKDYYDGLTWHRVIADFMIQGGCPTGTGRGGPGYRFLDETTPQLKHDKPGILSMANSDRHKIAYANTGNTNGSQFFITHTPTPHLDGKHTVFGHVTKGQDIVNKIEKGDKIVDIKILDKTDDLTKKMAGAIAEWDIALKRMGH